MNRLKEREAARTERRDSLRTLKVELPDKSYDIKISDGLRKDFGKEIKEIYQGEKIFIISDENVYGIYGEELAENLRKEGIEPFFTVVKPGERSKSVDTLVSVYNDLLDKEINRGHMIVALGGGVVGDLTGFVAATLLRGIKFIQIPTSLLAQIDSSVGGKVAVNLERGKNLVGNFYHPEKVLIDPEMLQTLDRRYLNDGTAEVIKYGCIRSRELFEILENIKDEKDYMDNIGDIIYRCCDIKREVVEEDEKDTGIRMILNFGHTIGHAIEQFFNYEKYTHGEAVAMGMYSITKRSEEKGETEAGCAEKIKNLLQKFNLEYELPKMDLAAVEKAVRVDKKTNKDSITVILIKTIGEAFTKKIKKEEISEYL